MCKIKVFLTLRVLIKTVVSKQFVSRLYKSCYLYKGRTVKFLIIKRTPFANVNTTIYVYRCVCIRIHFLFAQFQIDTAFHPVFTIDVSVTVTSLEYRTKRCQTTEKVTTSFLLFKVIKGTNVLYHSVRSDNHHKGVYLITRS